MTKYNSLFKGTFLYSLGPFINQIIFIAFIPWYSYILKKEELGYYDLLITTCTVFAAVATFKMADGLYRWLMDSKGNFERQSSAISNSLVVAFASSLLFFLLAWFISLGYQIAFKGLIAGYFFSTILFIYLQQLLRGLGYFKLYIWLSVINSSLLVILNLLFLGVLRYKMEGILFALIISNLTAICLLLLLQNIFKYISFRVINIKETRIMMMYSAPLIFNAVSWWLMRGFDRYVIFDFLGLSANGIYAVANKYAGFLILLNSFFISALQDYILSNKIEGNNTDKYKSFLNTYIIFQLTLVVFLSAISKYVIDIFIEEEYYSAWQYVPFLLAGFAFTGFTGFLGAFLIANKKTFKLFYTTFCGSLVNVAVSLLLVSTIGLYGPCVGILAGFFVTSLIRYVHIKKQFGLEINYYAILFLSIVFMLVVFSLFSNNQFFSITSILLSFILLLVMNRKIWTQLGWYFISAIKKLPYGRTLSGKGH